MGKYAEFTFEVRFMMIQLYTEKHGAVLVAFQSC